MMKLIPRLKTEYRSYFDLRKSIVGYRTGLDDLEFPCPGCYGRKTIYDPDQHCPIEGYKMADRIKCPRCGGRGEVSKCDYSQILQKERERVKLINQDIDEENNIRRSIKSKLSKEELDYLRYQSIK